MVRQEEGWPPITAVVSTRNRASEAVRTVETILANDHPCFAVILVDQGDDDRTEQAVRRFAERPEFTYLRSRTKGLSAGRNEGIARSGSEFIAMTDDDCEAAPDWLRKMAEAFQADERIGVVFGNVLAAKHDLSEGFIPAYRRSEPYLARTIHEKHEVEGIGACMGVRRSAWKALSGFDTSLGAGARFGSSEDFDFAIRALLAGYSVYAAPETKVVHHGFHTWKTRNAVISGYLYGIGAMYAKLFKARHWSTFIVIWHLARRWAFAGPVVDVGRKPPRMLRLKAFLKGFLEGMSLPVDRRTGHYGPVQSWPSADAIPQPRPCAVVAFSGRDSSTAGWQTSPDPAPKLVYLLDTWTWFGPHTGYAQIAESMASDGCRPHVIGTSGTTTLGALGSRLYAVSHGGAWCCAGRDRPSEAAFVREWQRNPGGVGHVLYFERHHPLFQQWRRAPAGLVATIHHPPNQMREWHPAVIQDLRRVTSAIALYQRDLEFFEQCVGRGRVKFVRYGVDTDFFRPSGAQLDASGRRLLFVGVNGRNLEMLSRVIKRLFASHPGLRYDLLVPGFRRKPREALRLAGLWYHPNVTWHARLSDDALRRLYQSSYLLLLPLQHAGVCNAIVEALACGLPVVTTDVGGVRDYGGGTVYPVVPNNNDKAMIELVEDYLASPDWRQEIGTRCRQFAEQVLSWSKSRQAHLEAYRALLE